jgi:hypothetical protein
MFLKIAAVEFQQGRFSTASYTGNNFDEFLVLKADEFGEIGGSRDHAIP